MYFANWSRAAKMATSPSLLFGLLGRGAENGDLNALLTVKAFIAFFISLSVALRAMPYFV